jgi:replication factor C large subunit
MSHLDADPRTILLWINENLPKEYKDKKDLSQGYEALSKADIFLGRTHRRQSYGLWSYACGIMNGGVATAKTHNYPNEKYNFPLWLREKKDSKNIRNVRNSIIEKIAASCHNSNRKSSEFLLNYFVNMFRNDMYFAIKMKQKYDLTETEIKYILGEKHAHKLKGILRSSKMVNVKPIIEKITSEEKEEKIEENIQQSLFDF